MKNIDYTNQRIYILIPFLLIFYKNFYELMSNCNRNDKNMIKMIMMIQFSSHIFLLLTNQRCMPNNGKTCSDFALIIGILYLYYYVKCVEKKGSYQGLFVLFVILYIIVSHIIPIYPIKNFLEYKGEKLPLLNINTYQKIIYDILYN